MVFFERQVNNGKLPLPTLKQTTRPKVKINKNVRFIKFKFNYLSCDQRVQSIGISTNTPSVGLVIREVAFKI